MPTIVLIRPGCTDFDDQHRIQGSLELPLNTRGQQQVRKIIDQLRSVELDIVYSCSCEPAISTAYALATELDIPLKETSKLKNLDQGLWEGMELEEVQRKFPKAYKQWQESPGCLCPPEGEQVSAALKRIGAALSKPLKKELSFAVVASEPLATLIADVIRGHHGTSDRPLCGAETPLLVEYLKTDSSQPAIRLESDSGVLSSAGHSSTKQ